MSALPKPLERWSSALSLFPRHLALELGTFLPRLAMAIGPLRARSTEGHDEPDGFDGLSRRGPYERLLAAEWAIAEEHPDEFNRRATSGEHAFFRLAFRAPAGHRRCLVLVDSGPSQLGTPRLCHLASLVVLERRAQDAKAEFLWGVLQQPPGRFLTGVNASAVEHWMRARSPMEPQPTDLDGWRDAFGPPKGGDDELWVLGGKRIERLENVSQLVVTEAGPVLHVDVRPRGGSRRDVSLPLPSDETCTQLIRDPLRKEAPLGRSGRPATNLVFIAGGSRLLYGTARETLVTHIIPGAPGFASPPTTWPAPKNEQVVAAGWDKGLLLVTMQGTSMRVNWYGKRGPLRGQGAWHLPLPTGVNGYGVAGHEKNVLGPCIQAPGWRLVTSHGELCEMLPDRTYAVRKTNVAAVGLHRGRLLTVQREGGEAFIEFVPNAPGANVRFPAPGPAVERGEVRVQLFHPPKAKVVGVFQDLAAEKGVITVRGIKPDSPVVFGFDNQAELTASVGLQVSDGRWRVVRLRKNVDCADLIVPPFVKAVHGVTCVEPGDQPALVGVGTDETSVVVCTGPSTTTIARASSRIVRMTVSPYSSHIAWEESGGLVCVYSLRRNQIVLRLLTEDA